MTPHPLFAALCLLWFASEAWIGRRRSADAERTRDAGTLRLLLATIYVALALAIWLAAAHAHPFAPAFRQPLFWSGLLLMVAGMALRAWSIRVLAGLFTVDVAIRADHRLVRSGPYRRLRHPAYTGSLMTFYGFALALGDAWSLLAIVVPVTAAFLWRIRVEERVLTEAFPDEYPRYAQDTKRLVPYLW